MIKIPASNIQLANKLHTEACFDFIHNRVEKVYDSLRNERYSSETFYTSITEIRKNTSDSDILDKLLIKLYDEEKLKEILSCKAIKGNELYEFWNEDYKINTKSEKIGNKKINHFRNIIDYIFSYKTFISQNGIKRKDQTNWTAYDLVKTLNVNVCPYCNRNYIFTAKKITGANGTRPELDHFFPKSEYPIFQLSFYNLIPSCHTCNHIKSNKAKPELKSPYFTSLVDDFKFFCHPQDVESLYGRGRNYKVKVVSKNNNQTIAKHNKTFIWEELYSNYGDIIEEMVWKRRVFSPDYKKKLTNLMKYRLTDREIDRMVFGNYTNPDEFHKRPLAKFMYDLARELKLIK
jgi:hypothetical protein